MAPGISTMACKSSFFLMRQQGLSCGILIYLFSGQFPQQNVIYTYIFKNPSKGIHIVFHPHQVMSYPETCMYICMYRIYICICGAIAYMLQHGMKSYMSVYAHAYYIRRTQVQQQLPSCMYTQTCWAYCHVYMHAEARQASTCA